MRRQIKKVIDDEVNPFVAEHGGHIELVDYLNQNVYLEMSGGCQGCAASTATLKRGIEQILRKHFSEDINEIIDVTDHSEGTNPYYESEGETPFN